MGVEEDVLRLQVAMHDVLLVQVHDARHQLLEHRPGDHFLQGPQLQDLSQVVGSVLEHQSRPLFLDEAGIGVDSAGDCLDQVDDVGVAQLRQDGGFFLEDAGQDGVGVGLAPGGELYRVEGVVFARELDPASHCRLLAEGPLAESLQQLVTLITRHAGLNLQTLLQAVAMVGINSYACTLLDLIMGSTLRLVLATLGIYVAYLTVSVLNERLFTHQYLSVNGEHHSFQHADLSVCLSSLFCAVFAWTRSKIAADPPNPIPFNEKLRLGFLYATNIIAINHSLLFISYPVRVVGDKCGYLTAVLVAVFFSRVSSKSKLKLSKNKIVVALLITLGTIVFATQTQKKVSQESSSAGESSSEEWKGYMLLLLSITAEAFFSDSQAYIKQTYKPTINNLMLSVNILTSLVAFLRMAVLNSNFLPALAFCVEHSVTGELLASALLQIVGQLSIYYIVVNYKQHMFPLIATTRKVFTVLLSIYIYQHQINRYQAIALIVVFGAMIYELADELYYEITGERKIRLKRKSHSN